MTRIYRLLTIFTTITVLALLTGCGPNGTTVAPTATATPSHTVVTRPTPASTATPASTNNTGSVTLSVNASSYRPDDLIIVTLSNQSGQTIWFHDHLTDCTIILLQRQVYGNWQPAGFCFREMPTRVYSLNTGQSLVVRLLPPFNGWTPGLYRAALTYGTTPHLYAGLLMNVYSPEFQVV